MQTQIDALKCSFSLRGGLFEFYFCLCLTLSLSLNVFLFKNKKQINDKGNIQVIICWHFIVTSMEISPSLCILLLLFFSIWLDIRSVEFVFVGVFFVILFHFSIAIIYLHSFVNGPNTFSLENDTYNRKKATTSDH